MNGSEQKPNGNGSNGSIGALVSDYRNLLWVAVFMMIGGSYAFTSAVLLYMISRIERVDTQMQEYRNVQTQAIARGDEILKDVYRQLEDLRRKK